MRALLAYLAMMEHDDAVGALYGRKAMRDDDGGAIAHDALDGLLYELLCLCVNRAGRFVKDE